MLRIQVIAVREKLSRIHSQDMLSSSDGVWAEMGCACLLWQISRTDEWKQKVGVQEIVVKEKVP